MKPGMQRDILVAYWLLFDEFEIGEDDPKPTQNVPDPPPTPTAAKAPGRPATVPNGGGRRNS
jgi:hypothetical protein